MIVLVAARTKNSCYIVDPITTLAANARNLRVDSWGRLSGDAKESDGSWIYRGGAINLSDRLGNDNGRFDVKGKNFTGAAEAVRVDGTTLRAKLQDRGKHFVEASFDLGLILKVVDGRFVIISECVFFSLLHAIKPITISCDFLD